MERTGERLVAGLAMGLLMLGLVSCDDVTSTCSSYSVGDTDLGTCADAGDDVEVLACVTAAFLDTLDADTLAAATYDFDDSEARTLWSNLPPSMVPRAGIGFGDLSDTQRDAAYTVARAALSDAGYADFLGVLAADDYLDAMGGSGTLEYCSDNYSIAVFGTPSATGTWALMIGGHHMAYNLTFVDGEAFATPNHLGTEPKDAFTVDGATWSPTADEGDAMVAIFDAMDDDTRASAVLSGQVFADVLLGPDEYGTGSLAAVSYPADRGGVQVSSLSEAEQALVKTAIAEWVEDFVPAVATPLFDAYTGADALADTYVAWAGDGDSPDVDSSGTYFRIDGPRVWIEVACQGGVVITGETHYHTIYRDKSGDYGASL